MRMPRGIRAAPPANCIELGPPVEARLNLASEPKAELVSSYVLTRGAEAAWTAVNDQLGQPRGDAFWIGGAAGSGKTHFLNYAVALSNRAGTTDLGTGRHLTITVDTARRGSGAIERQLVESIALQLTGDSRASTLWRQVSGHEALVLALDQARRQGVNGVMAALDLAEMNLGDEQVSLKRLGQIARDFKPLRLIVLAAGRADQCEGVHSFGVAPEDDEALAVICGRARRIRDEALPLALYYSSENDGWEPRQIYPLHPAAAQALKRLYRREDGIAAPATILREAIVQWEGAKRPDRLLTPAELLMAPDVRQMLERRLGEAERAGLEMAYRTAGELSGAARATAEAVIATIALNHLSNPGTGLGIGELAGRLPASISPENLDPVVTELQRRSRGILRYEDDHVYFNPRAASAPQITAFNTAIALLRRFDPSLTPASVEEELAIGLKRLDGAVASAIERCHRNRELLTSALLEGASVAGSAQQRALDQYAELAESGTRALIKIGADPQGRQRALKVVEDYESIAAVVAAVPRLRAIREYLAATSLGISLDGNPAFQGNRTATSMETECQLLIAAVAPAALLGSARNLDVLEARFHQFKLNYIRHYREAHSQWCRTMARLGDCVAETRLQLEALDRLNRITALGPPNGDDLMARLAAIEPMVRPCDPSTEMVLEIRPRCPRCDFAIGAEPPADELGELALLVQRALDSRLAALSQSAIARLIERYDHEGRLEGFLKITQAAQTHALIGLLDDKLSAYLNDLLNENRLPTELSEPASQPAAMSRQSSPARRTPPARNSRR